MAVLTRCHELREDAVFDDGSCLIPDLIVPDDYSIQDAFDAACSNCIYL